MTEISNTDRILLQLRLQLQRLKEGQVKSTTVAVPSANAPVLPPLQRMRRLANSNDLEESEIEYMLVAALLTEELGPSVANDPKFQSLTKQVLQVIERDPEASALLRGAIKALEKS